MRITTLLIALFSYGVLSAQTPISYGSNFTSNISTLGEEKVFTFQGTAGDRIYLRMRDAETPIDACYTLTDPNGLVLDDPCGNGGIVLTKDLTLNINGTYTITAKDNGDNDTGEFGMSLSKLNSPTYSTPIDCQFDATETLEHSTEVKTFSFNAEAGDKLLVRMRGENTHIESEIEIYNASGDLLTGHAGSGLTAIRAFEIPETGNYTMLAMDKNGNDTGNFGISLQVINKSSCTIPLQCGDNLEGRIDHLGQMIAYKVEVQEFDRLLFNARSSNPSFESQLFLYNPDGEIVNFTIGAGKQQEVFTEKLTAGNYQVIYVDKGGNDIGEYGISLQVIGINNCGEELTCFEDEIINELPSLSSMQACKFYCVKDDIISLKSVALDPAIDPLVNIYSSAGDLVATAESFQATEIENFLIDYTGEYLIVLKDKNGNDLGDLTLVVSPENISPAPSLVVLPTVELNCEGTLTAPTANMPCDVVITGTTTNQTFTELGEYNVTWTYENSAGNVTTQTQNVIVSDNTAPKISCTQIKEFSLNENGEVTLTSNDFMDMIEDDCTGVDWIELENHYFTCDNIGENEVTIWTADNTGNETSCTVTIVIDDLQGMCQICEAIPNPWKQKDIGNPSLEGSACYNPNDQTFEITGSGYDIYGTEDQFTFVYQEFCGDADLVAKVKTINGSADYAFGGIMMRQSLGPAVRYAGLLATNHKGVLYQARTKPNTYTLYEAHEGELEMWVKLERRKNTVSGYLSKDGINWELNCEIVVKLGGCYKAGLVVNSNTEDSYNTVMFSDVSLVEVVQRNDADDEYRPFGLALEDPCKFEVENRGDIADCEISKENEIVKEFPTFPNPAREIVNVNLKDFDGESIEVRLISPRGKVMFNEKYESAPYEISLPLQYLGVRTGVYTMQVISSDGTFSKFVSIVEEY